MIILIVVVGFIYGIVKELNFSKCKKQYEESLKREDQTGAITNGRIFYSALNSRNKKNQIYDIEARINNDIKIKRIG
jgi:cobalamin biosynthesis Co2+ chelatase CbiK